MDNSVSDLQLIEKNTRTEFALARDFKDGAVVRPHKHSRAQLLHTLTGVLQVDTPNRAWSIPPGRGLWIPPGVRHGFTMRGHVSVRTLYVAATKKLELSREPFLIVVTPLERELIIRALELTDASSDESRYQMVIALLMAELQSATHQQLSLPWPRSATLKKFANQLRNDPSDRRTLSDIAYAIGVSSKTLARRFQIETGLTPDAWRRHARMLAGIAELQSGKSVTQVAEYLGFESVSSFTAAFRSTYGMTPSRLRGTKTES